VIVSKYAYIEELYKDLMAIPTPSDSDLTFRSWHVEGLLLQGTSLLQRCVEERAEYFNLISLRDTVLDQISKENNFN
jgi:hypothetical protein